MHDAQRKGVATVRALLWPAAALALGIWAIVVQLRLNRLRRTSRVAFEVIRYWRRMARGVHEGDRYLTRSELAERIASRPLTTEQVAMVRRVLGKRRNDRR